MSDKIMFIFSDLSLILAPCEILDLIYYLGEFYAFI